MEKVYFIGAGPGDPELLTLKGLRLLKDADVIIYAGSLVNPSVLTFAKPSAEKYDSAPLSLDEIVELIVKAVKQDRSVIRLCGGDPSLYGALQEQIDRLEKLGIECEVVPGVSSFLAAAASLKRELTLPGVSQTVIIARPEGRTTTPRLEDIRSLAKHRTTMVIFLGVQQIQRVCEELTEGGYPPNTPVAVLYRVTWPEETIIRGTIDNISDKVERSKISKMAIVIVGGVLEEDDYEQSKLYDPLFTHGHRKGVHMNV